MDDLKFLWDLAWSPAKHVKKQLNFTSAVKLYYKLAVLPFIAYVVLGSIAVSLGERTDIIRSGALLAPLYSVATSLSYVSILWGGIILFFIALPLGIAIDALIYQLIGKFFLNTWKGNYDKTFTALLYGLFPLLLLLWLSVVPLFNSIFVIAAPIWSLIIIVFALSEQQKVTRLNAMLIMVIKSLVVVLFLALVGISVFSSIAYILGNAIPVASVGPLSNVTSGWLAGHMGAGAMPT